MLEALRARLEHTPEQELPTAAGEQRKITAIRLKKPFVGRIEPGGAAPEEGVVGRGERRRIGCPGDRRPSVGRSPARAGSRSAPSGKSAVRTAT